VKPPVSQGNCASSSQLAGGRFPRVVVEAMALAAGSAPCGGASAAGPQLAAFFDGFVE